MLARVAWAAHTRQVLHVIRSPKVKRDYVVHFDGGSAASLAAVAITHEHTRP
jgi:hypothetical protein